MNRLREKRRRTIFAPLLPAPPTTEERARLRGVWESLGEDAIFFAASENDLALGPEPGPRTFAFFAHPEIAARVLLAADRLVPHRKVDIIPPSPREPMLELATVCDRAFLPSLLGLVENLLAVHGARFRIHLLTLDSFVRPFLETHYGEITFRFHRLDEITTPEEFARLARRPIQLQAVCGKLWLLRRALAEVKRPILYTDLDVCFFRSPRRLIKNLEGVLLFPNWSDTPTHRHLCGLFNGGMMGVGPGAEGFLRWLASLSLYKCEEAPGFFFEQGYLDLAPLLHENVKIYRGGDEDVAPWNLKTLEGSEIGSFHAQAPDRLGLFAAKAAWDQLATIFSPLKDYPASFYPAILQAQRYAWPAVHRYLFARETLEARLKLPRIPITPRLARVFCAGAPARALKAAAVPYAHARRLKRRFLPADAEAVTWARAQHEAMERALE